MQPGIEWLSWIGSIILALAALGVAVRIVIGDRSRGRRRCPACWYDLSGSGGLRCSECGHEAPSERQLLRTRRTWWWLAVAALLGLAADSVRRIPDPDGEGWTRFVPTTAMILVPPLSRDEWVNVHFSRSPAPNGLAEAFERRLRDRRLAVWQERLWGWRLASWTGAYEDEPSGEPLEIAVLPATRLGDMLWQDAPARTTRLVGCFGDTFTYDTRSNAQQRDAVAAMVHDVLQAFIAPDSWTANGGTQGRLEWFEGRLFVLHTPEIVREVRTLLAWLETPAASPDRVVRPDLLARDRAIIADLKQAMVASHGERTSAAEMVSRLNQLAGANAKIRLDQALHQSLESEMVTLPHGRVSAMEVLSRLEAERFDRTSSGSCRWELVDGHVQVWSADDGSPPASGYLQVYDLRNLVDAIGSAADQPRDAACGAALGAEPSRQERVTEVCDLIQLLVAPERWVANGGAEYQLLAVRDRMVVAAGRRHHLEIASLLTKLRATAGIRAIAPVPAAADRMATLR